MTPALAVNLESACAYLDTLGSGPWTFQTFDDSDAKRGHLARVIHGELFDACNELARLNESGAGVFVTVNATDGKGRRIENVTALRALFVDGDGLPLPERWPIEPGIVVQRDAAHWHAYWLLAPGEPLDAFTPAQKQLARFYGTDPKVHDLPRVLRVPGFLHRKGEPFEVRLLRCESDPRYTVAEILDAHPVATDPAPEPRPVQNYGSASEALFIHWAEAVARDAQNGNRNNALFAIACEGKGRGHSESMVRDVCFAIGRERGLPDGEILRAVKSAYSKERNANLPASAKTEPAATSPGKLPKRYDVAALLRYNVEHDPNCLLGNRWLCKGGSVLWTGATGTGKSAACVQAAILWALGESFFGIKPVRPLKSVILQAENDAGDMAEEVRGIVNGLGLHGRVDEISERVRIYREDGSTGERFVGVVRSLADSERPDLLHIDNLSTYAGVDENDNAKVGQFLRNALNPVATQFGFAMIVIDHVGKQSTDPNQRRSGADRAYMARGGSVKADWARATLDLREVEPPVYCLGAFKRGRRAGLTAGDEPDAPHVEEIHIRHSDAGICWIRDASVADREKEEFERRLCDALKAMGNDEHTKTSLITKILTKVTGRSEKTIWNHMKRARSAESRLLNEIIAVTQNPQVPSNYHVKYINRDHCNSLQPHVLQFALQLLSPPLGGGSVAVAPCSAESETPIDRTIPDDQGLRDFCERCLSDTPEGLDRITTRASEKFAYSLADARRCLRASVDATRTNPQLKLAYSERIGRGVFYCRRPEPLAELQHAETLKTMKG